MGSHNRSKDLHFNFILDGVNVDWQSISAVDIDQLVRRVDVDALQKHLRDVTFCSLDGAQCQQCLTPVDPSFVKLFRLAQLSLQWLDYCQKKTAFNINTMEKKLITGDKECQKLRKKNKEQEEKMKAMVSELRSRRLIIQKQQSLFAKDINNGIQCGHCEKNYLNAFFLQKHMLRRHPDQCQNITDQIGQKNSEINSLKLEISNLRMQLAQAAKEHNQRLQEVQKVQQEKMKLHCEKEEMKLEKSAMQVEAENLQQQNFNLVIENRELGQENLDLRTENGQLEQENLDLRTENGQLGQDKLELRGENEQREQENLKLRKSNGQLEQENLDLKTANRELQCKNRELSTETRKLQQQNLSLVSRREHLKEEKLMLQVENLHRLTMKLQQENLALESENRNLKEENQVTRASSGPSPRQLPEPVLKKTPRSQNMKSSPQRASPVPIEQSEQESESKKTLNNSENVSGGGDGDSSSPKPTSVPETPASAISKSSPSSIGDKSGKKQRKSFFQRCCKELRGMWQRPLATKQAP
ncbi:zinc finger protein Dzip1-like [Takifugu rubripes]|uniref:zinc finger protein Dzip1-like n=1 Tax=Takifugu rubripes TaxID=31033 RepID=UPI0011459315|nr:zinc finger protein Dzip1-like [Takifugu rubripes]